CLGTPPGGEAWDALADDYEPGLTAARCRELFPPLRERLKALLHDLLGGRRRPDPGPSRVELPIARQEEFVRTVAAQIGFDFQRGRLDRSAHPFCGGSHCGDVRITTRFAEDKL